MLSLVEREDFDRVVDRIDEPEVSDAACRVDLALPTAIELRGRRRESLADISKVLCLRRTKNRKYHKIALKARREFLQLRCGKVILVVGPCEGGVLNVEPSHLCKLTSLRFKRGKISSLSRHLHL